MFRFENGGRRLVVDRSSSVFAVTFAALTWLCALGLLALTIPAAVIGAKPRVFRCDRATGSCFVTSVGALSLAEVTGVAASTTPVRKGGRGTCLSLMRRGRAAVSLAPCTADPRAAAEYRDAAAAVSAFIDGGAPALSASYGRTIEEDSVVAAGVVTALFAVGSLLLARRLRRERYVFDRDAGTLTVTRWWLLGPKGKESVPLSQLVEIDEVHTTQATARAGSVTSYSVEVDRRGDVPLLVASSYERAPVGDTAQALSGFLGLPLRVESR